VEFDAPVDAATVLGRLAAADRSHSAISPI